MTARVARRTRPATRAYPRRPPASVYPLHNVTPFECDTPGWWLVLSDIHVPYHEPGLLERVVGFVRKRPIAGILLNGDLLDSHELSRFSKDPRAPRYVDELQRARELLAWLRGQFRRARIIFKEGNHEERLGIYVAAHAPALAGLDVVTLPELLEIDRYDIEWVGERRVVRLGRLHVIHGHEYRAGVIAPVNPARGIYLRARSVVLCGHWHRTSEHHERDIRGRPEAAWSTGCLCGLSPLYAPLNNWNHGFAVVHLDRSGAFEVENRRVLDGRVV